MLATNAKCRPSQFTCLRLHALNESRQVGMSFRPDVVNLLADHRPFRHALSRGGYCQRVVLHGVDEITNGVGKRIHQQRRRDDDQQDADDHQNGRGKPLLAAYPAGEPLMQRIHRDRQDNRPHHQRQEWRKDQVAQHRQCANQTGANQHIQHTARHALFELGFCRRERIHWSFEATVIKHLMNCQDIIAHSG